MPAKSPRRTPKVSAPRWISLSLLACVIAVGAHAESPDPPPFYAIKDVTVVSGAGAPIEGATVLLADGLIEAVGTGVEIPADAWVIDGDGLFLYPGLIDALTTLGQKRDEGSGGGPSGGPGAGSGGAAPVIRGPEDRPKTTPWVSAADSLGEDERADKWRKAGFTATVTSPTDGFFAGQAALINLGGTQANENTKMITRTIVALPVALRINFRSPGRSRGYPGSLMGSLAYIQQVFSDTQHYTAAKAAYRAAPVGLDRPTYDRTLEVLEAAVEDGTPFLMPGHLGREIDRALALAREYDLPLVVYGGQGAYTRVDALKSSGASVLVSLNWPKEEKDRDPESDTSFRTLYHRRLAPTTPGDLAAAGVPFGFYSDGLSTSGEVFKKVRMAIDAGLSDEDALAALTTDPAKIYGVSDRLGTIEAGKIANLVLASDWPWADGAEVKAVFVDGRKYEERKSDEPTEPPASDVSGTWKVNLVTPRGEQEITADLTMAEDGKVTGEITGERGTTPIEEGRMSADLLRFKTTRSMGTRSFTSSWSLTVEGESVSGSASAGPMSMEVTGDRTAAATEKAKSDEGDDEAPAVTLEELQAVMEVYQGPVKKLGSFAITNATVWTVSGETIEGGTVVVEDGKITAVGKDVKVPGRLETIDAEGGHVIPGIIDAHSHIAIEGGVNEGSLAVTSMVAIGDVLNPDSIAIYRALAGGVTSANLLHGSANPIGGKSQIVKLRWGTDAEGLKFEGAPPGIKFALGENPKRSNFRRPGMPQRYPQTRMGVMDVIRQAFTEAEEYRKQWQAYESAKGSSAPVIPPRRDFELESLVEILEGERWVHSHCYRADEILQLMRLAEEFGFRIGTLQHVLEGYKVADEIAAHGAGASTFSDWWGYKVEAYEAIPHNAALMTERGVVVSINSDSGEEMRHLNQEAAKAIKWGGLSEVEALALVTLNPAKQLLIDDRVGSIEVGKDADLVIYDGNPLEVRSVPQKTFVDGDLYFDLAADRARQAKIDEIKKKLAPPKKDDKKEGEGEAGASESAPSPEVVWQDEHYSCREDEHGEEGR
jgi:imidazolonepropionase-like amidohydrolase